MRLTVAPLGFINAYFGLKQRLNNVITVLNQTRGICLSGRLTDDNRTQPEV